MVGCAQPSVFLLIFCFHSLPAFFVGASLLAGSILVQTRSAASGAGFLTQPEDSEVVRAAPAILPPFEHFAPPLAASARQDRTGRRRSRMIWIPLNYVSALAAAWRPQGRPLGQDAPPATPYRTIHIFLPLLARTGGVACSSALPSLPSRVGTLPHGWEPFLTTTAHEDAWPLLGQSRRSGVLMGVRSRRQPMRTLGRFLARAGGVASSWASVHDDSP